MTRPLSQAWQAGVRVPRARATIAGACLAVTAAMLVARYGTMRARLAALVILAAGAATIVVLRRLEAKTFGDPERTIRRVAGGVEPELAARAVRALSLLGPAGAKGASPALAELHVRRTLAALPMESVRRGAKRRGGIFVAAAFGLAATTFAACATNPWGVVEGADVLVAQDGTAPLGMAWLVNPMVSARLPDYLHRDPRFVIPYEDVALPRGTLITVRGEPVHAGRRLLLTDGKAEVPFVDDGTGQVVARWPVGDSVKLRVVARFGHVVIPEPDETAVESIPDAAPVVTLEGAPKRVVLASAEEVTEIPIHYQATDDHGLREVHLVMRAGVREERRVLARLDGETTIDRGGYNLRTTDAFIKKSHAPVEIRVEAKDNDPITGPKWGASAGITVVPPDAGEPEARRLEALRRLRDRLVDTLAWRLSHGVPTRSLKERRAFLDEEGKRVDDDEELLETTLDASYAGIRISGRLRAMLRGRMRKVRVAATNEARSPSTAMHARVVKATERMVLVVDAVIRGLGLRDTRDVAKSLAEVADDLAVSARLGEKPDERARADERMDAAVMVLEGGGRSMRRLGALGRDIGEIVVMDLSRVARARASSDLAHGALAAQDLAARLRQPDPSFGARGGRPSHAGGESGGGRGAAGDEGESSDVEEAFNEAAQELDRLAADHASNMGKVEQAIANGSQAEDLRALAEEAKEHAAKIREAARPLPTVGGGSDSWTSKGAAAREHAEQMARALEQGHAADAVESGRNALSLLEEAKRAAERERFRGFGASRSPGDTVEQATRGLAAELKWAEEKLDELRGKAARRAAPELRERGGFEGKLAERARELGKKGRDEEALPKSALEALQGAEEAAREAARALERGDADRGLERQRDAQRKLEMARDALGDEREGGEGEGDRGLRNEHADIPNADDHKGPEDFRKRVIEGLGRADAPGRLKDAVRRYAEGLLK